MPLSIRKKDKAAKIARAILGKPCNEGTKKKKQN